MVTPCALVTSCASLKASELVRQILSVDELPARTAVLEDVYAYPWHIDTKYYSADVCLCTTDVRTIGDQSFAEAVQAFVVIFDSKPASSLDQVAMWLPYLKELNPPVQILVCEQCTEDDDVSRTAALHWCLDNAFELVELNPVTSDTDCDEEDDFKETVGVQRIIEALSCHCWPNLVMKEKPAFRSAYFQQIMDDAAKAMHSTDSSTVDACCSSDGAQNCLEPVASDSTSDQQQPTASNKPVEKNIDVPTVSDANSQHTLGSALDVDEEVEEESFEQLFERLRIMKDAAAGMSTDQRKKYAEKVTMQFWQAVGGNLDEFEGLSSDSDNE